MRPPVKLTDEQLLTATGKNWEQWMLIMAQRRGDAAEFLRSEYTLDTWWSEVIAGQCAKELHPIRVRPTIEGSLRKLFQACRDSGWRAFTHRPIAEGKRAVEASDSGGLHTAGHLAGDGVKTRVVADQAKAGEASSTEKMWSYWTNSLDKLRKEIDE